MSASARQSSYRNGAPVGFREAISLGLRTAFVWRGRASRSAYWWFVLFEFMMVVALYIVLSIVFSIAGTSTRASGQPAALPASFILILTLIILIPSLYLGLAGHALMIRRLHDTGRSGWWHFISVVPFAGPIVLLVWLCTDGDAGSNGFGGGPATAPFPGYSPPGQTHSRDAVPPGSPSWPAGPTPPPTPADQPQVILMSPPAQARRSGKRLFGVLGVAIAVPTLLLALFVYFVYSFSAAAPLRATRPGTSAAAASAAAASGPAVPAASAVLAPESPRTEQWLHRLASVQAQMTAAMGSQAPTVVTPATLRPQARQLSRCSAELAALGPATAQLRPNDREARHACADFERAAACDAAAIGAYTWSGDNPKFGELLDCSTTNVNNGSVLLADALEYG